MMISDGLPWGYQEAAYAIPDSYPAPAQDFLRYLTGEPKLDTIRAQMAEGRVSLPELFDKASANNLTWLGRFDELPDEEFDLRRYARPPVTARRRFCTWGAWR